MFDINTGKKKFNLTYYDYSTHATKSNKINNNPIAKKTNSNMNPGADFEYDHYPYYHFTSSSDGTLITLNKKTGIIVFLTFCAIKFLFK